MEYCGIDLHAEYSQICILYDKGEVMRRRGSGRHGLV